MGNGKDKLGASYSRDRLGGYISHNMGNQRCDKKEKGKKSGEKKKVTVINVVVIQKKEKLGLKDEFYAILRKAATA